MSPVLEVKNLYKVFGETPQQAFPLLEKGLDKDQIFEKTGLTVGSRMCLFQSMKGRFLSLWVCPVRASPL